MKKFTQISNKLIKKVLLVCICLIIILICGVATLAFIIGWSNDYSNQLIINRLTTITTVKTSLSANSDLITNNYTTFFINPTSTNSIQNFSQNFNHLTTNSSTEYTANTLFITSLNTNAYATITSENFTFNNSTEVFNNPGSI